MYSWIGSILGGFLLIYILQMAWEMALFMRVCNDPLKGKIGSVLAAYLTAGTIAGFGMADGGPYAWHAFSNDAYWIPALIIGVFAIFRGLKLRAEAANGNEDLTEAFR